MATGHWNPGYGDVVSRLGRAKSALPTGYGAKDLRDLQSVHAQYTDQFNMDEIRRKARDAWLKQGNNETSYQDHYREKHTDVVEPTTTRPTSSSRKNKPHPPLVFLSTRLHNVPGYHNPDASLGKSVYRVDASVSPGEQEKRAGFKSKFVGLANSGAVNQYKTQEELELIEDPVERQATQAYMKLLAQAGNDDESYDPRHPRNAPLVNIRGPAMERSYRSRTVPSLHRYLREAGAEEAQRLDALNTRKLAGYYDQRSMSNSRGYTIDVLAQRSQDLSKTRNTSYVHKSKRGDFLMHPEWTPSIAHHRLNGLSSVDIPYMPDSR